MVLLSGTVSMQTVCAFGRRAGFDVETSCIFPQGFLTTITYVGGGAKDGGLKSVQDVRQDFSVQ